MVNSSKGRAMAFSRMRLKRSLISALVMSLPLPLNATLRYRHVSYVLALLAQQLLRRLDNCLRAVRKPLLSTLVRHIEHNTTHLLMLTLSRYQYRAGTHSLPCVGTLGSPQRGPR